MKWLIAILLLGLPAAGFGQVTGRTVLVSNSTYKVMYPTNFWSVNAPDITNALANIGFTNGGALPAGVVTNYTDSIPFEQAGHEITSAPGLFEWRTGTGSGDAWVQLISGGAAGVMNLTNTDLTINGTNIFDLVTGGADPSITNGLATTNFVASSIAASNANLGLAASLTNNGLLSTNDYTGLLTAPYYNAGTSKTPPLGWLSWYGYGSTISEAQTTNEMNKGISNGYQAAGYKYIVLDDGTWIGRYANSNIVFNTNSFPSGTNYFSQVRSMGYKAGVYTEPNDVTSAGSPYRGTPPEYAEIDARQFLGLGVKYVKFDAVGNRTVALNAIRRFSTVLQSNLADVYVTTGDGNGVPLTAGFMPLVNSIRKSGDATYATAADARSSFKQRFDNVQPWAERITRPGLYMDVDCVIGAAWDSGPNVGGMLAQHAGCAILPSPIMLMGFTARSNGGFRLVDIETNPDLIAIHQDSGVFGGRLISSNANTRVYARKLADIPGAQAVMLWNTSETDTNSITVNLADIGIAQEICDVKHVWSRAYMPPVTNSLTMAVPPYNAELVVIHPGRVPPIRIGKTYLSEGWYSYNTKNGSSNNPAASDYYYSEGNTWRRDGIWRNWQRNPSDGEETNIVVNGVGFTNGIAVYPHADIPWFVGGYATNLHLEGGPLGGSGGNMRFSVKADGVTIWTSAWMADPASFVTNLNVAGADYINVLCEMQDAGINFGRRAALVNSYFERGGETAWGKAPVNATNLFGTVPSARLTGVTITNATLQTSPAIGVSDLQATSVRAGSVSVTNRVHAAAYSGATGGTSFSTADPIWIGEPGANRPQFIHLYATNINAYGVVNSTNANLVNTTNTGTLTLATNTAAANVAMTTAGWIGINKTPTVPLDVTGAATISGNFTAAGITAGAASTIGFSTRSFFSAGSASNMLFSTSLSKPMLSLSESGNAHTATFSGLVTATNGFNMPTNPAPSGITNGLARFWNSNGVVFLRTSTVGSATEGTDKPIAP